MPSPEINDFTDKVVKHIKFFYDRDSVKQELTEHMEDMIDDYAMEGMSEAEAVSMALINMGEADEIGRELNAAHNPVLGTIWLTARTVAVVIVIAAAISIVSNGINAVQNIFGEYDNTHSEKANIVYSVEVGEKFILDDMRLVIDEVIYYDDGELEVRYRTWDKLFSDSIYWTFELGRNCFYDENGNTYLGGGGFSGGGPINRHQTYFVDFPSDAEKLIVDYDYQGRSIYCEIPLGEGSVYEADK
ncbi:MAG: permease prefix domain 1-containing protein [Clostridiales bacterium]|nr:permease prefix domain 1-containing protein [Clostridiales bacterium]